MSEKPVRLSVTLNDRNPRHQIIIDWLSTSNYKTSSVIVEALIAYIEQETTPHIRKKTRSVPKRSKNEASLDQCSVVEATASARPEAVMAAPTVNAVREMQLTSRDTPVAVSGQEDDLGNALEPTHRVKHFLKGLKFDDDDDD